MRTKAAIWVLVGVLVGSAALAAYWLVPASPAVAPNTASLTVAATIFPLADIVRHIGGERVNVLLVIPPGVSEHSSALTPQQIQALQQARAIFQIGHNLDTRLVERITAVTPDIQVVTVDNDIALREFGEAEAGEHEEEEHADEAEADHDHDTGVDPHYWLTVPNAITIARTVAATLEALDPAQASAYRANLQAYEQELEALEDELQTQAQAMPQKEFIAMHDAWSYLAHHYGLELVATYEPVEGREPSLRDIEDLRQIIAQHDLATFYAEPQKASSAATNFMRREFGLRILTLDPVGGTAATSSYIELMRFNLSALAAGARQ